MSDRTRSQRGLRAWLQAFHDTLDTPPPVMASITIWSSPQPLSNDGRAVVTDATAQSTTDVGGPR